MTVDRIQWRRFNNTNDLDMFLRDPNGTIALTTTTSPDMNVTISNASGAHDASLEIQSRTNESAVGFYLPSFTIPGREEVPAQSFVIYRKFL